MRDQIERWIYKAGASADPKRGEIALEGGRSPSLRATPQTGGSAVLGWVAAVARLIRLHSGITSAAAAIVTGSITEPPVPAMQMTLIAVVALALSNGGHALNDIFDRAIDEVNQPGRPIPGGRIGLLQALLIGAGNLVVAIVLALLLSGWCITLTLIDVALLVAYAVWSKSLGILKNIIVGYLLASGFLIGAYTFDRMDPQIGTLAACAFFATIARELVKDVQDIDGDRRHGARTVPIMFGPRIAYAAAFVSLTLCLLVAAIPYAMGLVNNVYLVLFLVAAGLFVIGWFLRNGSARTCQYLIMAGSIVVLVAFALGHV